MADTKQSFQWSGITRQGRRTQGVIQAQDAREAQVELKKQGIEIISMRAKTGKYGGSGSTKKVKLKNIVLFTRYLATMLSAGLPIIQALDIIAQDQENQAMHSFVLTLRTNVASGKTLTETFKQYPQYFSELYCSLISAGEKSGTLEKILKRLGIYLERSETLRAKIKKALTYPAAILVVAFVASSILLLLVVPKFETIFNSFGAKLPFFTQIVIDISKVMQNYWWLIIILIMGGVWSYRYAVRTSPEFRRKVDTWMLKMFVIGPILRKGIIARYTRTLSTTLDAGMPIIESMKSMSGIMGNVIYGEAISKIADDIASGHQLSAAMSATNLFPTLVIQMISVGEASGTLGDMLTRVAEYYEEEVNNIVDNLSSLLEPLIMAVLGVIIGSLIIAMYLPIFKLGSIV
jgi:type IV pilus assembly protein PilC